MRVRFESFDHVFNKALKPTAFGSRDHARYTIEPERDFPYIKHPVLSMLASKRHGSYPGSLLMTLEFVEAPSNPHQTFLITLSFDNGIKLEKEVTVDIRELKK